MPSGCVAMPMTPAPESISSDGVPEVSGELWPLRAELNGERKLSISPHASKCWRLAMWRTAAASGRWLLNPLAVPMTTLGNG